MINYDQYNMGQFLLQAYQQYILLGMNPQREFVRLATVTSNRIELDQQGVERLQQFDFVSIATLEGSMSRMPPLIDASTGTLINNIDDCIWMSKYPLYSSRLKKYMVILKIASDEQRKLSLAHAFCSLLSNVVIVCNYQNKSLRYLVDPSKIIRQQTGNIKAKMAGLIGLTQNGDMSYPSQNVQKFTRALESQALQRQMLNSLYSYVGGYQIPSTYNLDNISFILPYIQDIIQHGAGNSTLILYGEVMKEYAVNLAKQLNSQGVMDPSLAQQLIEVDPNFQDYITSVDRYNNKCKNMLGNQPHADIGSKLQQVRSQTEQEELFQINPYYAKKLGTHMDRKEAELNRLNEQLNDTYNINLLQKQSEKSLINVTGNNATQEMVQKQIDRITSRYNDKARGNNKDKLFNQFMQVFVPTIYTDAGVNNQTDKKINALVKENQNLQEQIKKLQKKKSSKCCEIM